MLVSEANSERVFSKAGEVTSAPSSHATASTTITSAVPSAGTGPRELSDKALGLERPRARTEEDAFSAV